MIYFIQKFIQKHLLKKSLLSFLLLPLSFLYLTFVSLRRFVYLNLKKRYKSKIKIISVGNIVSGGVGKTPFVIFLSEFLRKHSQKIAVSHRDYRGKFENYVTLISDREKIYPISEYAADEALLIAKNLKGIPVICGKNRKLAIKILENKFPDLDYIILDDSFQHLSIYHDYDFVIFNETIGIGNGFVLPAGILREPLSSLKFADILVWNGKKNPNNKLTAFSKPILKFHYEIENYFTENINDISQNKIKNGKKILISAIGNPKSFEQILKGTIFDNYIKHLALPDHFLYTKKFLNKLKKMIKEEKIDYIITTEKDYTKLKGKNLPLIIIKIKTSFEETEILERILL